MRNLAIDACIKMVKIVEFQFKKISIKMKTFKTFYEAQKWAALRKLFTPSHQTKAFCVLGTNIFWRRYAGICRHLLSKRFENAVLGRLETVQCKWIFLRFFARDIFLEIGFCVILQSIQNFFGPGTTRISSGTLNYTVKLVIFFGSFCWQWWLTFLLSPIFC